jgi:hypothetical protein
MERKKKNLIVAYYILLPGLSFTIKKREIQKIPTSGFESQIAPQPLAQLFPKFAETLSLSQGFPMPIFEKFGEESSVRQRWSGRFKIK